MEGSVHRATRRSDSFAQASPSFERMARPRHRLSLRALRSDESRPVWRKPGLTAVGVNRDLPGDALSQGEWSTAPEGNAVWRLALTSPGSETLRVHFKDFHAGAGKVWVLGTEEDGSPARVGPYSGDGLFGDGEFWSDVVPGDSIIIAYEPATSTTEIPFRLSQVAHRLPRAVTKSGTSPVAAEDEIASRQAAASCNLDVSCYSEYSEPASAVALIIFESDGGTYECSGALVSSASQPALPYFVTANHCVSTSEEARSVVAFFNYQTSACNGTAPSLSRSPRVNGASFIAGGEMALGDFTLLRLTAFPDIDVKVLGWSSNEIASNQQVTGISHPVGDFKRIAFGERTRDVTIRFDDGERMPANKGYQVAWFQGVTQSGSSGSPLLVNIDGKQYLAGTLTAGPDVDEDSSAQVCRTRNLVASYGRFSEAYPYLAEFLTSGTGASGSARSLISASPNPIQLSAGQSAGRTVLTWQAVGIDRVQVRVGSATGPAMTGIEGPTGSAQTGDWVVDGLTFYLQDARDGNSAGAEKTIATVTVRAQSSAPIRGGTIVASPNPTSNRATRLTWQAVGVSRVQIRVNSPNGPAMTGFESPTGSTTTGPWVSDGMVFYLQDASDGASSGASRTIASVRVRVSRF